MSVRYLMLVLGIAVVTAPSYGYAQGTIPGAERGAREGEMQPARLEQLSEAPSAPRPEPWTAFLGVQETPDARLRRFVGKQRRRLGDNP